MKYEVVVSLVKKAEAPCSSRVANNAQSTAVIWSGKLIVGIFDALKDELVKLEARMENVYHPIS